MREKCVRFFTFAVFVAFLTAVAATPLPAVAQLSRDGVDNDLDGSTDYPAHLDCTSELR